MTFTLIVPTLLLLAVVAATVLRVELRGRKHARTLENIARLERELAIAPNYVQIHKRAMTQLLLYGGRGLEADHS